MIDVRMSLSDLHQSIATPGMVISICNGMARCSASADAAQPTAEAELQARVLAVIGAIPSKLLAASRVPLTLGAKERIVPLMELPYDEYPHGPSDKRMPGELDPKELSAFQLQGAAHLVFEYLHRLDFGPSVEYVYDGDTRTYSIQIVMRIATRA